MLWAMSTDRDLLPLHERQAARAAIEQLVQRYGSQAAAGEKLGVSQNAVNKALLYTKVGPSVMRLLLGYLEMDLAELLRRYGDPAHAPAGPPAPRTMTPKEEAIMTAARFAPGASEKDIRTIAAEYDAILQSAQPIEWLETLLREVQRRILIPQRQQRLVTRRKRSEQRALRNIHDSLRGDSPTKPAPATTGTKRSSAR
jgi:hypothetical protein